MMMMRKLVAIAGLLPAGVTACFQPTDPSAGDETGTDDTDGSDGSTSADDDDAPTSADDDDDDDDDSVDDTTATDDGDPTTGGCDPSASPSQEPCVVDDAYGIFVALQGDDANDGTRAAPVNSLRRAIELAQAGPGRVYACTASFADSDLVLPAGVSLFGGFDCEADWVWTGTPTVNTANGIGLRVLGAGTTAIEDFELDVATSHQPGGSTIGLLVHEADVALARVALRAGDAGPGDAGIGAGGEAAPGPDGNDGLSGQCVLNQSEFEETVAVTNRACPETSGGAGGNGGIGDGTPGDPGGDGTPAALGGDGGNGAAGGACTAGQPGDPGPAGSDGEGGAGAGAIGPNGYTGTNGTGGDPGTPGGGGGGGGGNAGYFGNCITRGQSGAGGGAGGCGGEGATGGSAGGSSIALVSVDAMVALDDVLLHSRSGGAGGDGAAAQAGGDGGQGGSGFACAGGDGAAGGRGGHGGGGSGGHSLGIAFVGGEPVIGSGVTFELGVAGQGGAGGGGLPSLAGADGLASDVLAF
jgi:hypothetical protein